MSHVLFSFKISPGASAADHSINTLRYADRTKSKGGVKKSPVRVHSPVPPRQEATDRILSETDAVNVDCTTTTHSSLENRTTSRNMNDPIPAAKEAAILQQAEEAILSTHISNIQENAELLTLEGALLAEAQLPGRTSEDVERYLIALEEILDHKEDMILSLRRQMVAFQEMK
jgi:kinesin family member 2/24